MCMLGTSGREPLRIGASWGIGESSGESRSRLEPAHQTAEEPGWGRGPLTGAVGAVLAAALLYGTKTKATTKHNPCPG